MAGNTFIALPKNLNDPVELRRFLDLLILKLDVVFGNRVQEGTSDVSHTHDDRYYTETEMDLKLLGKSDVGHNHNSLYTKNEEQASIAYLSQTISSPPTQAEVQAISDKLDSIIEALGEADIINKTYRASSSVSCTVGTTASGTVA